MENFILIDDDLSCIFSVEYNIGKLSPESTVKSFSDPLTALSYISSAVSFDPQTTIFLDLNMPEMNGWDFLEIIQLLNIKCSIYILTASINQTDKDRARKYPIVKGYVEKPLYDEDLEKIIENRMP
jgi:two-component SAPR family response regulator